MQTSKRIQLRKRRQYRARRTIIGTPERPRMCVQFTGRNIYVQFIDDSAGKTIASTSSLHKSMPERDSLKANVPSAEKVGKEAAKVAQEKGISAVVFDRAGARYHGKVKALADAAREAGLQF